MTRLVAESHLYVVRWFDDDGDVIQTENIYFNHLCPTDSDGGRHEAYCLALEYLEEEEEDEGIDFDTPYTVDGPFTLSTTLTVPGHDR